METTTFNVPSITCSICSNKIQQSLKGVKGVNTVSVDLKTKTVNVDYEPHDINPEEIRKNVSSIGYEVIQ
ncbi:copper chaperone CopZ [Anaerobacterium chartisolvens]|uniref:Copper chaperone CopZ n=1 Tax=Anaerobacterium chartisolvens TaxID=1297424 RepID=A0A369B631_9FIRM|nr:heavy metal-associated domain-containing protein [Anaerobacterium chartisolvens]RCX16078.1 copper chaperone CopZ [Anaerobacterium chartisolvens]